jgi:uncharacterized protein YqeY
MDLRSKIKDAIKTAMKEKEAARLSTLRLLNAAIQDRDISLRAEGREDGADEAEILAILAKMVKQRQESAQTYEEAGRLELAERERAEILVIEGFMPRQLTDDEIAKAVEQAIADTGADTLKDMGKVMGALKADYAGQMDFKAANGVVKDKLSGAA